MKKIRNKLTLRYYIYKKTGVQDVYSILHKRRIFSLLTFAIFTLFLMTYSSATRAFICKDITGAVIGDGGEASGTTSKVYVNLSPQIQANENLVVDLSSSISCQNTDPTEYVDWVALDAGTNYLGSLGNFTGTVQYYGSSFPLPFNSRSNTIKYADKGYIPWNTKLFLSPTSAASGVVISQGDLIAIVKLYKAPSTNPKTGAVNGLPNSLSWNIYANNDVVIPTGGCDVSARDVTVTLPDYPGSAIVPVTVRCAKNQNLAYYLSGTTTDSQNSIFINSSSSTPAKGIGVQMMRNGSVVPANTNVSLGTVGTSPVNLGMTATYARTGGQVTAGNLQSVIGVTFVYE